ncbi:MAG: alkaline phosphatase family protein [Myxococcota bacterium]|nr:alkaline phosphatase family protein [Myxococcota bacterium]
MTRLRHAVLAGAACAAVALACARQPESAIVALPPTRGQLELPAPVANRPARLLVVSIHGLMPSLYLGGGEAPAMPTLAALARAGVAAEAVVPVFPAASYPAHATLVTGREPASHGLVNAFKLGQRGVRLERHDAATDVQGATIWQLVAQNGDPVAALDWPATGGAAISDLLPDARPTNVAQSWPALLAERASPRVAEAALRAGAQERTTWIPGRERDAVLRSVACELLASSEPPRLTLLRLSETEAALALNAPASPAVRRAFAGADASLGALVECLRTSGRLASTALAVVGDRGATLAHTELRPNVVLEAAGLLSALAGLVVEWDALSRSNGGTAFVYARHPDAAVLARRALEEWERETGAFRILAADEMLERGGDPKAWFGLEAEAGWVFGNLPASPSVGPALLHGAGGYGPEEASMTTGFVGWGAGWRAPLRLERMRQKDLGPTLARLVDVPLDDADGRVAVGLLQPAAANVVRSEVVPNQDLARGDDERP